MKIALGLSGGVDSAVCGKLLKDAGHEVLGIYMKNWSDQTPECPTEKDLVDAQKVAKFLGIKFLSVDFSQAYWEQVFTPFLETHKKGHTPSPDILCNQFIKFAPFLDFAKQQNCEKIAMGHYADVQEKNGEFWLKTAKDKNKDQTYFLHTLNQNQLASVVFPLAKYEKPEIRKLAKKWDLPVAEKKDSTGICFVGKRNYQKFLSQYIKKNPGEIREITTNKKVGTHIGLSFYTIGQSKDLGIGGQKDFSEGKWFVAKKDFANNILLVTQNKKELQSSEFFAKKIHWINQEPKNLEEDFLVKIRHRDPGVLAKLEKLEKNHWKIITQKEVFGIAPGQSAVIYKDEYCLGGGIIE